MKSLPRPLRAGEGVGAVLNVDYPNWRSALARLSGEHPLMKAPTP